MFHEFGIFTNRDFEPHRLRQRDLQVLAERAIRLDEHNEAPTERRAKVHFTLRLPRFTLPRRLQRACA